MILLIATIILASFSAAPAPNMFWEPEDLRGNVKYVLKSHYYTSNNYSTIELGFQNEYEFNKDGTVSVHRQYDNKEKLKNETKLEYDRETGLRLKAVERNAVKEITRETLYKYNDVGQLSAKWEKFLNINNESYLSLSLKYDEHGNKIEQNVYNREGELTSQTKFFFDDRNHLISYKRTSMHFGETSGDRTSNDKNLPTEVIRYGDDGEISGHWKHRYDEYDNEVELKSYHPDGSLKLTEVNTYEYDDHGNWIKKTSMDNVDTTITERKIKYYK